MLHTLGEINDTLIEGLVDISAFMSINFSAIIIQEFGIIHLVSSSESYKTTSNVVIQALGKINELHVRVGDVQCLTNFMVVDINMYDILLGLDFLIKIGMVVDIEKGMIQIRWGQRNSIQVLSLNMVNMLQIMSKTKYFEDEEKQDETLQLWGVGP